MAVAVFVKSKYGVGQSLGFFELPYFWQ